MATVTVTNRNLSKLWTSNNISLPAGVKDLNVQVTSNNWPASEDGRTVTVDIDQSFDAGATWQHWVGVKINVGARNLLGGGLPSFGIDTHEWNPVTATWGPGRARLARVRVLPSALVNIGCVITTVTV